MTLPRAYPPALIRGPILSARRSPASSTTNAIDELETVVLVGVDDLFHRQYVHAAQQWVFELMDELRLFFPLQICEVNTYKLVYGYQSVRLKVEPCFVPCVIEQPRYSAGDLAFLCSLPSLLLRFGFSDEAVRVVPSACPFVHTYTRMLAHRGRERPPPSRPTPNVMMTGVSSQTRACGWSAKDSRRSKKKPALA